MLVPRSPLRTALGLIALVVLLGGLAWHLLASGGGESQHRSITEHTGYERIGFVEKSEVDRGTVWVYAFIAPEFVSVAERSRESEPIETAEGPQIRIYKLFPAGSGNWLPPAAHAET